jgi:hypothetical protein
MVAMDESMIHRKNQSKRKLDLVLFLTWTRYPKLAPERTSMMTPTRVKIPKFIVVFT